MFRIFFPESKLLKNIVDVISNFVDEVNFRVNEDGISIRAMDSSRVALLDIKIGREILEEFELDQEEVIGIDLDRFEKILKRAKAKNSVGLEKETEENVLKVIIRNGARRQFELPLIEVAEEEIRIPELDYKASVEIDADYFLEIIKDVDVISDYVTFSANEDMLRISGRGELGSVNVTFRRDEALSFNVSEPCEATFGVEYLKDILSGAKIADTVRINLGKDLPLKLEFVIPGCKLVFYLAPRVEETVE